MAGHVGMGGGRCGDLVCWSGSRHAVWWPDTTFTRPPAGVSTGANPGAAGEP